MGGKRMSYSQNKEIERLLAKHVEVLGDGMCRYRDDASDASIAAEMRMLGHGICSKHHVAAMRLELYGKTRPRIREEMVDTQFVPVTAYNDLVTQFNELVDAYKLQEHRLDTYFEALRTTTDEVVPKLQRDVTMILEYLTRAHGVNWTLEAFRHTPKVAENA